MSELEKLIAENQKGIKPCPFCGGDNSQVMSGRAYRVKCLDCYSSGAYGGEEEAVRLWNHRPREEKLAKVCRELVDSLEKYLSHAYRTGVVVGMLTLRNEIDGINKYSESIKLYEDEFKGLFKQALARAEEIAKGE